MSRPPVPLRAALLACVLLAVACARLGPATGPDGPLPASREAREEEMNRAWERRPLAELLKARGRPQLILDIPGGGNPPGFVLVYPRDAATGCLDTFAMAYGRITVVRTYQCR